MRKQSFDVLTEASNSVRVDSAGTHISIYRVDTNSNAFDLWYCRVQDVPADVLEQPTQCPWLQHDGERWQRFRFTRDKDLYLTTRMLARAVLSQYADMVPEAWLFERTSSGRPFIATSQAAKLNLNALRFSLSRSGALAACAVSRTGKIGLDVETTQRKLDIGKLSDTVLAPPEQHFLEGVSAPDKSTTFLRFWTLKEAYLKALGTGLSVDLRTISFTEPGIHPIELSAAQEPSDSMKWHFTELLLEQIFLGAVAYCSS